MSRAVVLAVKVGLAVALLVDAAGPLQAALTERGFVPAGRARQLMLAQAPVAPAPNVEANIAELRQRLAITPVQEPQFSAFANILRQNARTMPSTPPAPNVSAVEGLRLAIQYGQQYIDGLRRMLPALQALYATLTPAQKQAADQMFRQGPGE